MLFSSVIRLFPLVLMAYSLTVAQLGESILQTNLMVGHRSEAGAAFRYTGWWGIYGEAAGGLTFILVEDNRAPVDPLTAVWALAPRLELGQQLLQGNVLGWEAYAGVMPWGRILDNSQGEGTVFDNNRLHWDTFQGYVGTRIRFIHAQPSQVFWSIAGYAELGYTRFQIARSSPGNEKGTPNDSSWTAAGPKLRLGLQAALGWRMGAQPVQRSLSWAIKAHYLDSAKYEREVMETGLEDAHPLVRRSVLPMVKEEARLADIVVQDADSTVRQDAMARIREPGLRRYLETVQRP